jgi:DNA-binding beta-propeller fold protein YncE
VAGGRGAGRGAAGAGTPGSSFGTPSDVAWDRRGNIYIADGIGTNNRIAKFDKDGRFLLHWGQTGSGPGQFNGAKAIALDAQDNVYVADMGNKRIQVFDAQGTFKSEFANVGTPRAMCITRGGTQYLYVSHAGDEDGMDDAAIYKVQLDGKVVGKFGTAGKQPKEFGLVKLDRLPQRERAARRRDDELARAETHGEALMPGPPEGGRYVRRSG